MKPVLKGVLAGSIVATAPISLPYIVLGLREEEEGEGGRKAKGEEWGGL